MEVVKRGVVDLHIPNFSVIIINETAGAGVISTTPLGVCDDGNSLVFLILSFKWLITINIYKNLKIMHTFVLFCTRYVILL